MAIFQKSKQENEKSRHFVVSARCSSCTIFELVISSKEITKKINRKKIGRGGDVPSKLVLDSRMGILKIENKKKKTTKQEW